MPVEILAYKTKILAGNQNPPGPLARYVAQMLENLKGLVNKPRTKLTLDIVLVEVLQLQTKSIEHIIHNWKKLTGFDTQLQHTWLCRIISGIIAAINGI